MSRRATVTTDHGDPERARQVAAALRPDNTAEMETTVDGATVRTVLERETTGSLHSTVDDYVVNLTIADRLTHP
ncbi:MAG: KEOPS complex subunit Pcc1 [Haloglomus sp.]